MINIPHSYLEWSFALLAQENYCRNWTGTVQLRHSDTNLLTKKKTQRLETVDQINNIGKISTYC